MHASSGLAKALATLAREGTSDLREVVADLRRRDSRTANHLLLALYGGGARPLCGRGGLVAVR